MGAVPPEGSRAPEVESLRAIPWVFAWTQNRFLLPSWYGAGTALGTYSSSDEGLAVLREMYRAVAVLPNSRRLHADDPGEERPAHSRDLPRSSRRAQPENACGIGSPRSTPPVRRRCSRSRATRPPRQQPRVAEVHTPAQPVRRPSLLRTGEPARGSGLSRRLPRARDDAEHPPAHHLRHLIRDAEHGLTRRDGSCKGGSKSPLYAKISPRGRKSRL